MSLYYLCLVQNRVVTRGAVHRMLEPAQLEQETVFSNKHVNTDYILSFASAVVLVDDPVPNSITAARLTPEWPQWLAAIESEMKSLQKRNVFGDITDLPQGKSIVGYRWVFAKKRNDKGVVVRFKARLVAQGYTQVFGIDCNLTYSPVMDGTTFRFLVGFATLQKLSMKMMDVVTAFLYGDLDVEIYMKVPDGLPGSDSVSHLTQPCVQLKRSLYGLKQSGRMWFHRLATYLIANGFANSKISPCVFIKRVGNELCIIAVYVDDLNLIGTPISVQHASSLLDREFEMKDLGVTSLCIGIQLEHVSGGLLMHQALYTTKLLQRFNMADCHAISTPMVVRHLDKEKDQLGPCREGEELISTDTPYLSAIGALMYLANTTRPDIAFAVNLLARFSNSATQRHWTAIHTIMRYLKGTIDMGLFYSSTTSDSKDLLIGYADAGYKSDPHNAKSQTGFVFLYNKTAISWRSTKQTLTATSSNLAEIIALHEASRECIWLRKLISNIQGASGFPTLAALTPMYEDNAACIEQMKTGFIKGDKTKHIDPKFFFTSELQGVEIDIIKVASEDNIADIFTKSLGRIKHQHFVNLLGLRKLSDLIR